MFVCESVGFVVWGFCGIIRGGRVAEWLMALVLKTSRLTSRRFESCPFRQAYAGLRKKGVRIYDVNPVSRQVYLGVVSFSGCGAVGSAQRSGR